MAQSPALDSARVLSTLADSAAAQANAEGLERSIVLRHQALTLFRRLGDRSGEGTELHRIGNVFYVLGQRDSALRYFYLAAPVRQAAGDRKGEGRSLNNIGIIYDESQQPDSAFHYYRAAWSIARELHDRAEEAGPVLNLGNAFQGIGRTDSALTYYREAIAISRETGDRETEGQTENNVGALFKDLGPPDSALVHSHRALGIAREVGDRRTEAAALVNIGADFADIGEADSALAYYRSALDIQLALADPRAQRESLMDLGIVFDNLGQRDSALARFRQSLELALRTSDRLGASSALTNLATTFHNIGQSDSALAYFSQALPIKREISDRRGEGTVLGNTANVLLALGRADSALSYAQQALAISQDIQYPLGESTALHSIADAYVALGKPDSAIAYFDRDLRITRQIADRRGEGITLTSLGILHAALRRLGRAVAYFDSAASVKAAVARRAGGDFNRLSLGEIETELFDAWTRVWLARAPEVGRKRAVLAALAASERGRAQALLDLMGDTTAVVPPGADLGAEGARLIAGAVAPGVALISYLVAGDTMLAWVARSSDSVVMVRTAIRKDSLAARVAAFRAALGADTRATLLAAREGGLERGAIGVAARGAPDRTASAWALSRLLFPSRVLQNLAGVREIVLIPHGALALVPFAALPIGPTGRFLGTSYALRYAPSLGTLKLAQARTGVMSGSARGGRYSTALIVGNPAMPQVSTAAGTRATLAPLQGAERESALIAGRLGIAPLNGPAATEAEVRRRLPNASLVHLATHGFAYSTEALARKSFVALAPGEGHDGLLSVGEILDDPSLKLSAELIVLSACQTGLGDLKQAEGTVGFQRALLARGARSVLVSLWSVSDEATRALMERFYRHWLDDRDHPSKAESLRRAQEEVRRLPGFGEPRFWAAFQLVGAR